MRFKKIKKWYISHHVEVKPLALFDKDKSLVFINRPYPIKLKHKLAKGGENEHLR
ncbi:hypothetical protein P7D17_03770 [Lactococcus petauri]|uniref:Uncharacterized protein n=1 Tax=Lactococcus petauri TaxID=1940789 RepID=A0AAJ2IRJ3_9LACT|nr:hypothetical protein [Lactococcus petauri]MDT2583238.1 hypothetical protein [Lactococcus petauri]